MTDAITRIPFDRLVESRTNPRKVFAAARPQVTTDPATAVRPKVKPVDWKPRRAAA